MHKTPPRLRWSPLLSLFVGLAVLLGPGPLGLGPGQAGAAEEEGGTLLLDEPDVSAEHVAFVYAQDIWLAPRTGGTARRLTSAPGRESRPRFSPDGTLLAFSAEWDGQTDVYVLPVTGGTPQRLTWHPGSDVVAGWSPDGTEVLFTSRRHGHPPDLRLYGARLTGGTPRAWPLPAVGHVDIAPDGRRAAYTPVRDAFGTWKRYRGGRTPAIWIQDLATHDVDVVPHVNASDTSPVWFEAEVWFLSDRSGQMNLFRFRPGSDSVQQVTTFGREAFGAADLSVGPDRLVFTRGGALHLVDPATGTTERLVIHVPHDDLARRPRWQSAEKIVRSGSPAPNGRRAVFEVRGEIVTVPREHGAPRNLSQSPGVHERGPVWSPDGTRIAWFSDATGEYELVVAPERGLEPAERAEPSAAGEMRRYALDGAGFYQDIVWSPDGTHLLFADKANALFVIDLASGAIERIAQSQGSLGMWRPTASWSPDGAWIAYEVADPATAFTDIALLERSTGERIVVTDGFADAREPRFAPHGGWLWFRASVDAGPQAFGLDMSTSAARETKENLYVCVLARDGPDPFGPRSDEAADKPKKDKRKGKGDGDKPAPTDDAPAPDGDGTDGEGATGDAEAKDGDAKDGAKGKRPPVTKVDRTDLDQRILALPVGSGRFGGLQAVEDALLFLSQGDGRQAELRRYDVEEREAKTLVDKVQAFVATADGKHLLLNQGDRWELADGEAKKKDALDLKAVKVLVDPAQEWPQILREVWRLQRDFFYDPGLHAIDWDAAWAKWSPLVAHVRHRADLNRVIGEMMGELCCGHEYVWGGEMEKAPEGPSVGLLGCDWEAAGERYRFARIYRGQNWNPGLRAPLTAPGVDVRDGDVLLRVNGREVTTAGNVFAAFVETAGRPTQIEVAAADDLEAVRRSTVVPLEDEGELRHRAWIEANRRRVDELSGGRLAYVYMPNTGRAGMASFDRDFYSQLDKQGLVLDERYNGGGQVADYVIDVLRRDVMCWWINREGWAGRTPFGTLRGPKVMLINAYAGSGGDWMPWMFQRAGLGPLVGTRTWGGLVGISGYPPLMDGGGVTAASFGIVDTDGRWVVENVGVAPDVEVIPWPKDVLAGRDPQLEKAVALALEALEAQGPPSPPPAYTPPTPR